MSLAIVENLNREQVPTKFQQWIKEERYILLLFLISVES